MVSKQEYYETGGIPKELAELYLRRLGDVKLILNLGCGTGSFARYTDQEEVTVVGIDKDERALDEAAKYSEAILDDLEVAGLPFKNGSFDGIVAKDILEHLERPERLVAEMHRVLCPGGTAVVSVPMPKPSVVWDDYTHVRGFTEDALRTMFKDYGFKVASVTPMGGVPGAEKLGFISSLPTLLSVPLFSRFAVSHEAVVEKI